jgi:hypothetical protein
MNLSDDEKKKIVDQKKEETLEKMKSIMNEFLQNNENKLKASEKEKIDDVLNKIKNEL